MLMPKLKAHCISELKEEVEILRAKCAQLEAEALQAEERMCGGGVRAGMR